MYRLRLRETYLKILHHICIDLEKDSLYINKKIQKATEGTEICKLCTSHLKFLTESQAPTNNLINCMYCIIYKKTENTNRTNKNDNTIPQKDKNTDDQDAANLMNLAENASLCSVINMFWTWYHAY